MLAVALPGVAVRDEYGLDLVEELLTDQLLMTALVEVTLVRDVAGVVGIGQQPMDARERQRTRSPIDGSAV